MARKRTDPVSLGSDHRTAWMFPRNIRRIEPWKIAQIAALVQDRIQTAEWAGNQEVQNYFTKALESAGLKRPGTQYHIKSGGARTYLAQLRALGVAFGRKGRLYLTRAGHDLAVGERPLPILRSLLLRMQYPSAYSSGRNVDIDPGIRVKPCVFVLQLLQLPGLSGYVRESELIIPVVLGHNHGCVAACGDLIAQTREGRLTIEAAVAGKVEESLPRSREPFANARDIANTLKNWMLAAALLVEEESADGSKVLSVAPGIGQLVDDALDRVDEFIDSPDNEESYQRAYGSYDRSKDTRNLEVPSERPLRPDEPVILAEFYRLCGEKQTHDVPESFYRQLEEAYGFRRSRVAEVIEPYVARSLDFFEARFLQLATGGTRTALEFERAVTTVLSENFRLSALHCGQKKRPNSRPGGYADVLVLQGGPPDIGLLDAKAIREYSLPIDDLRAMQATYAPNATELTAGAGEVKWCGYIAGGYSQGIDRRLDQLSREVGVPIAAISAHALLRAVHDWRGLRPDEVFARLGAARMVDRL